MPVNFSGTWIANLSKSTLRIAPPAAITAHIRHENPELEEELVVRQTDGSESRAILLCRIDDNQPNAQLNRLPIRGVARWDGDELVIETWAGIGPCQMHLSDRWSLSAEGQTLTMEHREGDLAGQRTVFQRAKQ